MKIVTIVGARPQFIKAASVSRAIQKHNKENQGQIREIMVHTGQHYDENMSQVFFDELEIREPDYNLGVGSGTHGQMTGAMLEKIEEVLLQEKPDIVLVYGDTNSTLAGALAASKLHFPVGHVEAGLRSFNRQMPEEINRVLTDHVSTFLFCPTDTAVANLKKEGITKGVFKVGDVMFDSFLFNKRLAEKKSVILSALGLKPKNYCLATVHRQENTTNGKRLSGIFEAFNKLASQDCPFIAPLHPRTAKALDELGKERLCGPHVRILEPISYLDMILLETHARVILTDSGGVQKEAYFAKTPCITLREETEWVELVEHGYNVIAGCISEGICGAFADMAERSLSS
ncbi:MAG: UDP-N-acetylglucosamine 2-epimerase (non-hydrolyzing), partial [Desulfobacteraceae bacterium]